MSTRSRATHRGMPKKEIIFDYWDENHSLLGSVKQGDDWGIFDKECFACGSWLHGLQRCHIRPLCMGGDNNVENLHLLCPACHCESENIPDYWGWMRYKRYNEWEYGMKTFEKWLRINGIYVEKEAEYLASINATREQIDEHCKQIIDRRREATACVIL